MKYHYRVYLALIVLLALTAAPILHHTGASAATPIYVRPDGDDINCNGEVNSPASASSNCAFQTINYAISQVDTGGTVLVGAGTYIENIVVNRSIILEGINDPNDLDAAVIDGTIDITSDNVNISQLRIEPGSVTGDNAGIAVYASNVVISSNVVNGITGNGMGTVKGIHIYNDNLPATTNIQVNNNRIEDVTNPPAGGGGFGGADGVSVQGVVDNVTLSGNTIVNITSAGWAYGIEVSPTGSAPNNPPQNVTIDENDLVNVNYGTVYGTPVSPTGAPYTGVGVVIDETAPGNDDGDAGEVTVFNCSFETIPYSLLNKDTDETLNGSGNWLGSNNPVMVAASVYGLVDYTPWLDSGTDTSTDPGFQGDFSTLHVEIDSPQVGIVNRIQEGIDLATVGGTVNIEPGTYTERAVINKSLTLRGSGAGSDPTLHTILDGSSLGIATSGIHLPAGVTHVTIEDLTVQDYMLSNSNYAGISGAGNNNNFSAQRVHVLTNTGGRGGLYLNGPVDNVLFDNVTAHENQGRGIVIWNGHKTNITITNNDVRRNYCCGIELQDGTASGVTMSNNTVIDNQDSGMSAIGLTSGSGPNLIADNIVTNNGRFGIEIKNPNGSGLSTGDGSIVLENNNITFVASAGMNDRDHAGIAVFRRDFQAGNPNGYVDVPTGVIIRNNTVGGYQHLNQVAAPTESEGFGISVGGTNHTITGNDLDSNDIGIQVQGGNHPNANYVYNDVGFADQSAGASPAYFGRDNAPIACNNIVNSNIFSSNGQNLRDSIAVSGSGIVTNADTGKIFCSIQSAIDDASTLDGHSLQLASNTYAEEVQITKDLTINGNSTATTILNPTTNTDVNNGDLDAWWLVDDSVELYLNNMTFDGTGYLVSQAIRHKGEGSITNVDFTEIKYNPSTNYRGIAVTVRGSGPVNFTNVNMSEIGRIGIHFGSSNVSGSVVDNLTYTGKGSGDFLDYGVEFGWGAQGTVQNSQISGNRGVAEVDGSTSACIYATTYFGSGTTATIINTDLSDCSAAISLGFDTADTTEVTSKGNIINNVDYSFSTTGAGNTLMAYANNIANFTNGGINGALGTINARHNWWGSHSTQPTGVDNDSWAYRLGAPVSTWADGTGSISLTDSIAGANATLSGAGELAIVNHGSGLANVPFDKGITQDTGVNQCADFYDIFVINGSGSYNIAIPVDSACTSALIDAKLFQFALNGAGAPDLTCTPDTACWNNITATRTGDVLNATVGASDLLGTPFSAPSRNNNDPTNIHLHELQASSNSKIWLPIAVLVFLLAGTGLLILQRNRK